MSTSAEESLITEKTEEKKIQISEETKQAINTIHTAMNLLFNTNHDVTEANYIRRRAALDFIQRLHFPLIGRNSPLSKTTKTITTQDGSSITMIMYRPKNLENEKLPFIYLCHGGGFCLGNIDTYEPQIIELCLLIRLCIIYVDYRLAPQYKFPIPITDCSDGLIHVLHNSEEYKVDNTKYFLVGDSAGGSLCINVYHIIKNMKDIHLPLAEILLYPVIHREACQYKHISEDYLPEEVRGMELKTLEKMGEFYINPDPAVMSKYKGLDIDDDYTNFPPCYLLMCEYDYLSYFSEQFSQQLKNLNRKIVNYRVSGAVHGIWEQEDLSHYVNQIICTSINDTFKTLEESKQ
ncbi:hypothetical protein WA158_000810 [Blastocystis sp. Blastoise]